MVLVQFREEWAAIRDLANTAPGVEFARSATRALCAVRQNFPFLFDVASTASPGFTPALGSYPLTRAFWDLTCRENPIPPERVTGGGLVGGQCVGVGYTVTGIVNNANLGSAPGNEQTQSLVNCIGPLRDVQIVRRAGGPGRQYVLRVLDAVSSDYREAVVAEEFTTQNVVSNPRFRILPADNCPPVTGVPPLPEIPPSTSFPITVIVGGEERTRTVNLPDLDVTNWPQFTFSPTIEIDGITVSFDVGGVNISYEGGTATPPEPGNTSIENEITEVINNINNVNNTVNNIENEVENVTNTVNNITQILQGEDGVDLTEILNAIKCCCCEDNVTYEPQTVVNNSAGGVFNLPDNTVAIIISGSGFDLDLIRTQIGGGSSPTVFYWGWCAVCYGDSDGGERIPLQFETQSLSVNELAKAVLVSPTHGARCSIVAIVKEKNCNV